MAAATSALMSMGGRASFGVVVCGSLMGALVRFAVRLSREGLVIPLGACRAVVFRQVTGSVGQGNQVLREGEDGGGIKRKVHNAAFVSVGVDGCLLPPFVQHSL